MDLANATEFGAHFFGWAALLSTITWAIVESLGGMLRLAKVGKQRLSLVVGVPLAIVAHGLERLDFPASVDEAWHWAATVVYGVAATVGAKAWNDGVVNRLKNRGGSLPQ